MPELGEVWSVGELVGSNGSDRLEAVVIATGPSRIRLVTRTGRRIVAPVSSWERVWHLVRSSPSDKQDCEREGCTQEAFFRHHVTSERGLWVCEDHLPHGATAQFPGDPDSPPDVALTCFSCGGPVTQLALVNLTEGATVSHRCTDCDAQWCPLVNRGLGDDGTILARALHELKALTTTPNDVMTFVEIRMGYRSYRDLCRALGVGNTQHIDGIPIIQDSRLDDQLTLAIETRGRVQLVDDVVDSFMYAAGSIERHPAPSEFAFQLPQIEIKPNSFWRRRVHDHSNVVRVSEVTVPTDGSSPVVHYEYHHATLATLDDALARTREQFLQYWAPTLFNGRGEPKRLSPEAGTLWRHRDTRHVVQIIVPTTTHVMNSQVSYRTSRGGCETTPETTFHRLYTELPLPPEDHVWAAQGKVFKVRRKGSSAIVSEYDSVGSIEIPLSEFLETYDPLVFQSSYDVFLDEDDPSQAIFTDAQWEGPTGTVLVTDLGLTHAGETYVRYRDGSGDLVLAAAKFLETFHYVPPPMPCAAGETWAHRRNEEVQVSVIKVNVLSGKVTIEERGGNHVQILKYSEFIEYYRKLYIRTHWEILEDDADDQAKP